MTHQPESIAARLRAAFIEGMAWGRANPQHGGSEAHCRYPDDALVPQAPEVSREVTYTVALRFGDTWVPQHFGAGFAPPTAEASIERAAKYATERPYLGPALAVRVETVVTALDGVQGAP